MSRLIEIDTPEANFLIKIGVGYASVSRRDVGPNKQRHVFTATALDVGDSLLCACRNAGLNDVKIRFVANRLSVTLRDTAKIPNPVNPWAHVNRFALLQKG